MFHPIFIYIETTNLIHYLATNGFIISKHVFIDFQQLPEQINQIVTNK
jgi:hypothetical protein